MTGKHDIQEVPDRETGAGNLRAMGAAGFVSAGIAALCLGACGGGGGGGEPASRLDQLADNLSIPEVDSQTLSTTEGTAVAGTVTGHDPDGNELRYYLSTPPAHGSVSGLPPGPMPGQEGSATGNFVYTPVPGFVGSDAFGFVGNDGDWNSSQGRVGIRVTAKGVVSSFQAAKPEHEPQSPTAPSTYLAVIHPLDGQGTGLYALQADADTPPVAVAETHGAGRITEAGWFAGQRAVYYRSDGALFLWYPDAAGAPVPVWPTTPGRTRLGEVRLSSTGAYLAFVASDRGAGQGDVFMLDASFGVGRKIEVATPSLAGGWPAGLRFEHDESTFAFDLAAGDFLWTCRVVLVSDRRGRRIDELALDQAACEAR